MSSFERKSNLMEEPSEEKKRINLKTLKFEVSRLYYRAVKKMGKIADKSREKEEAGAIETMDSSKATELQSRLEKLRDLHTGLSSIKSVNNPSFSDLLPIFQELQIDLNSFNESLPSPENSPKISAQPPKRVAQNSKKPYHVYKSSEGIEIYVGKQAEGNDELSCNPEHRRGDEWWLHVNDFAGSHVVIKCNDDSLPITYRETLKDACVLAAVNSKAKNHGRVAIHLTRCRNVSKPKGAKPGLVYISGDIRTVNLDLTAERKRLESLEKIP